MNRLYHSLYQHLSFPKRHKILTVGIILFLVLGILTTPFLRYTPVILNLGKGFLFGSESNLKSENGRINFLLLGIDGPKNDPSGRTDTILFLSLDLKTKKTVLISIPRDVWIPQIGSKINSAYTLGNLQDGVGTEWAKKYVAEILGQPIDYTVVISFDGFIKIIDLLGGIDVNVERTFTDNQYPISGKADDTCNGDPTLACRWEAIAFEEGNSHFDGTTALKFARSRHAQGIEGTDFARGVRQQKIILAVKDKILSPSFFLNPKKVSILLNLFEKMTETDIPQEDEGVIGRIILNAKKGEVRSEILTQADKETVGLLTHPPLSQKYNNEWVLIPNGGSWDKTHKWVSCLLSDQVCNIEDFATKSNLP